MLNAVRVYKVSNNASLITIKMQLLMGEGHSNTVNYSSSKHLHTALWQLKLLYNFVKIIKIKKITQERGLIINADACFEN
jgi:hypothetical protein